MRPGIRRGLQAGVLLVVVAIWVATALQRFGSDALWWIELSRFLPYPLLLAPAATALLLALPLGWRWTGVAAATVALVASFGMGLSWRLSDAPVVKPAAEVRLMTWNAKVAQASGRTGGVEAIEREIGLHHPDVVVLQDAGELRDLRRTISSPLFGLFHVWAEGQYFVASRLPLTGCAQASADGLGYARCTVTAGDTSFELRTVHFESPRPGLVAARREGVDGFETWRQNHAARLAGAQALARSLATAPRPLVLAGDLNAAEASAVVQSLLAAGLRDAFSSAGRGYGYTYGHSLRPAFSFLRIDHILVSPEVGVRDCFVGGKEASAHRPVIADLVLPR